MYNIFTQWLTLSVIFFAVIYNTQWLEVVTLGGLLTGTALLAAFATLLVRICRRLPVWTFRAVVIAGTMFATELLVQLLPGYVISDMPSLTVFLVLYALMAVVLDRILEGMD